MTFFGTQPRIGGSKFFPPVAAPVCKLSRCEILAMPRQRGVRPSALDEDKPNGQHINLRKTFKEIEAKELRRIGVEPPATGEEGRRLACSPEVRAILNVATALFGITIDALVGEHRNQLLFYARRYAARRMRDELRLSQPQIARILQRDNSTVFNMLHGRKPRRKS